MEGIGVEKVEIPVTGGSLFRRQVVIDIVSYIEDVNKLKERLVTVEKELARWNQFKDSLEKGGRLQHQCHFCQYPYFTYLNSNNGEQISQNCLATGCGTWCGLCEGVEIKPCSCGCRTCIKHRQRCKICRKETCFICDDGHVCHYSFLV